MSPEERLARLEAQMVAVMDDYDDMRSDQKEMKADIRLIRETLQEARGGWRVLMLVGGAGATVGGLLVKFLPMAVR